jgi:hypothetical protein
MRRTLIALHLLSAFLALAYPARAQQPPLPPGYFVLQVCNQSAYKASMAVGYLLSANGSDFLIRGWWVFEPRSPCLKFADPFPKGMFYHHEEVYGQANIYWPAADALLCVRYPGPWTQPWTANTPSNCRPPAERPVWFTGVNVTEDLYTVTLE